MGIEGRFNRREFLKAAVATAAASVVPEAEAKKPKVKSKRPESPLNAEKGALIEENDLMDINQVSSAESDEELAELIRTEQLVPIPANKTIKIDSRLSENFRYIRPWTARFLKDLGAAFHARFNAPIQINSAVRTAEFQRALQRRNRNAAPADGPERSTHLRGATIDIAKLPLSRKQLEWMQMRLLDLKSRGLIKVAEEHHQQVFHIVVSPEYPE